MLHVLVNISLEKFSCRKETQGYAKEKVKKKKRKKKRELKKWTQRCLEYLKQ
jgi:hypothetical protein